MSWKRRSAGRPPTLWCVLIFCAAFVSEVALDDVGIEGPLREEVDAAQLDRLLLEHADELVADDPPLLLGVLDPRQPSQEALACIDHHELHTEIAFERRVGAPTPSCA